MNNALRITDNEAKVKDALQLWAEWMQQDRLESSLGYGRCVGFDGSGNVSGWDDFERRVEKNMAINVQAIYEGLTMSEKLSVDHFHLSAVWKSNRTNIEDDYKSALIKIEIGLRRRGLL